MLQDLVVLIEQFLTDYGYLAIFLLMFVEEAGVPLPLPNEVALMYIGYLAYQGKIDANLAGLAATLGATAGSGLLYTLARRGGRPLIHRYGRFIHVTNERIMQAERVVARWGPIAIPIARLTPGLRIATTIIAGILNVHYRIVIISVVGVSLVWSYFWIHLGRLLGDRWEEGARAFERAGRWGIVAVVAVIAVVLLVRWLRRRRESPGDEPPSGTTPLDDADRPMAPSVAHDPAPRSERAAPRGDQRGL